ncbi:MAG: RibD family protein [Lachnospiraceae bacterium]|nr:RibD family protein [Lachnospiraceae bacterium]
MHRPYIICHMITSIDGKVTGTFLSSDTVAKAADHYFKIHRDFQADGFACGRITMEDSFTGGWYPDLSEFEGQKLEREDYIADYNADFYAVAFDRHGSLGWKDSRIHDEDPGYDQAHIVEVLCEDVSDAYLAYLRSIGVSYLFAGKEEIDLSEALYKLWSRCGIRRLLLEGGSILNGAFQRADLIDELSLVQVPVLGEKEDKLLFDNNLKGEFQLIKAEVLENGVWLRYHSNSYEAKPKLKLSLVQGS